MKYVFFILVILAVSIYANTFVSNNNNVNYSEIKKNLYQDSLIIDGSVYYNCDGLYKKVQK